MSAADASKPPVSGHTRALSDTVYASLGLYAEYLFGLVASILAARALGPADLGIYGLVLWLVGTGVIIANAGITTGAIKFIAELRGAGQHALIPPLVRHLRRLQRRMMVVVLAAMVAVYALARERVMPGIDLALFGLLVGSLALRAPYMFNIALAKGGQDFRSTAIIALTGAGSNLLLVTAAFAAGAPLAAFVAVYAIASMVFYFVSDARARKLLAALPAGAAELPAPLRARVRHHLRVVAATLILTSVGTGEFELLFLNLLGEPADAGVFKVANALALGAAILVPGVLALQSLPIMANAYGHGADAAARRIGPISAWLLLLGAPLVGFVVVFADPLIALLYGAQYAQASPVLAGLIVARVLSTLGHGASAFLVSADRQSTLAWLTVLLSVLRLGVAWWAIGAHGLQGAVAAAIGLSLLGTIALVWLALREGRTSLPGWRMLRMALAAAAAVVAACTLPLQALAPPAAALAAGTLVFALLYPLALWLLRCFTAEDARFMRELAGRLRGRSGG
jgi:O-antigen/teichoic acid export membrane protein